MSQAVLLIDQLKRELKSRGITYAQLAKSIGMSEASVKRMFSQRNMTLDRVDEILTATGIELAELTGHFDREQKRLTALTLKQEEQVVDDPKLFLVAVCALNLMSYDEIYAMYAFTEAELVGTLTRLDKLGFIELLPNNRFKLKVARTFSWVPNGPIMQAFKNNTEDFFDSEFAKSGEALFLLNARLSAASRIALVDRLKRLAREFSEQHYDDSQLASLQREPVSLLIATRTWHLKAMAPYLRKI
ncbi:MAG: helix-turn-helix transcriptional regulator [Pseudomonadota bacterium]